MGGWQLGVCGDDADLARQIVVLDGVVEPGGVVALPEMKEPCLVIEASCHLAEGRQVHRPKVQAVAGAAKKERSMSEVALRVLSQVAQAF